MRLTCAALKRARETLSRFERFASRLWFSDWSVHTLRRRRGKAELIKLSRTKHRCICIDSSEVDDHE
jgi:hypothetical protein